MPETPSGTRMLGDPEALGIELLESSLLLQAHSFENISASCKIVSRIIDSSFIFAQYSRAD